MKVDGIEVSIESSAAKANAELDKLALKLTAISKSISGINIGNLSNIGTVSNTNKAGVINLSNSLKKLTTSTNNTNKTFKSFAASAGKFYANCFLMIRGVKKLGDAIGNTMDYIETYNYYNVIMDKIGSEFGDAWKENGYSSAESYANSFRERLNSLTTQMTGYKIGDEGGLYSTENIGLGLDPEKIMSYQANISAVTNSLGLMGEVGTNTSKALTMLSADLSSLKNQNLETVMTNLQSGLIGQSRALYKYGIDITNNTLQTYAYANGIEKAVSEMTQAEKMQLRLLAILDQSKVAYGDMANTISGVANQYRIFQQQISNLARTIGTLFIPVIQKVLPYINGFIIALQKLFTWIGNLLGVDWSGLMDGISAGYSDSGIDGLADDAAGATDSLEDAKKAADKLKKSIFGYDELNIRADNSDSGSGGDSGSSGGIDLSGQIASALADYESVWNAALAGMENKAQAIADKITAAFTRMWKAIEPFREAISRLWNEGLSKLAGFTWTALKDFYNEFLVPIGEWAFGTEGKGLTRLVDIINNGLMAIQWDAINKNLKEFWIAIEPYAENFGEGLIDFFEDISGIAVGVINKLFGEDGVITGMTDWLNDNDPEKARGWGYSLGVLATNLLLFKGLASIVGIFAELLPKLGSLAALFAGGGALSFSSMAVVEIAAAATAVGGLVLAISNFSTMLKEGFSILNEYMMSLGLGLTGAAGILLGLSPAVAGMIPICGTIIGTIVVLVKDNFEEISAFFTGIGTTIGNFFTGIWDSIKNFISPIINWINTSIIQPIVKLVQSVITTIKSILQGLWIILQAGFKIVSTVFDTLVIQPIVKKVEWFRDNVLPVLKSIWDSIKKTAGTIASWIDEHVIQPVAKFFGTLWDSIGKGVASAMNVAISSVESAINFIIKSINTILGGFNKVVSWAAKIAEVQWGGVELIQEVRLGRIPALADGGIVNAGSIVQAGEAGPEILANLGGGQTGVLPVDSLEQSIENGVAGGMAQVAMSMMSSNQNGQIGEIHIHHHVGMSETVEIYKIMKEAGRVGLIPKLV